jgi:hypothetical protein
MASFPNVESAVPCPVATGRALLLAVSSTKCAALSNAAVDAAGIAQLELATLQRNALTSASSRTAGVPA